MRSLLIILLLLVWAHTPFLQAASIAIIEPSLDLRFVGQALDISASKTLVFPQEVYGTPMNSIERLEQVFNRELQASQESNTAPPHFTDVNFYQLSRSGIAIELLRRQPSEPARQVFLNSFVKFKDWANQTKHAFTLYEGSIHGNAVLSILGFALEKNSIVAIPFLEPEYLGPTPEETLSKFETSCNVYVEKVSEFLATQNIRILSTSAYLDLETTVKRIEAENPESMRAPNDQKATSLATEIIRLYWKAWERLAQQNPSTLFFVSAGNTGRLIDEHSEFDHTPNEPNLVFVSSITPDNKLFKWSDYTFSRPHIAGPGVLMADYAPLQLENMFLSLGSSFSTPFIANRAYGYLRLSPTMDSQEILQTLYQRANVDITIGAEKMLGIQIEDPWSEVEALVNEGVCSGYLASFQN